MQPSSINNLLVLFDCESLAKFSGMCDKKKNKCKGDFLLRNFSLKLKLLILSLPPTNQALRRISLQILWGLLFLKGEAAW